MRILILSGNTGEGHNSAARALKEGFEAHGCYCQIQDGLVFMSPQTSDLISKGHVFLYRNLPKVYGLGYKFEEMQAQKQPYQEKLDNHVAHTTRKQRRRKKPDLKSFIETGNFDAIICVHVFAARLISELRCAGLLRLPCFFLATDYTCSPGVNQLDMDAWLIPHPRLIAEFAGYGIPKDKLIPVGIPVRSEFFGKTDRISARQALSLPEDRKIIVLSCGSMGAGAMGRMVLTLTEALPSNALLVAICGNNHSLEHSLNGLMPTPKLKVIGYTHHMSAYMDAADIYISKPGGLSTTEAVHKRVPTMLINAVPGCETRNMEFLTNIGCAVAAADVAELAQMVAQACSTPHMLDALTQKCAQEFDCNSSELICDCVLSHCTPADDTRSTPKG